SSFEAAGDQGRQQFNSRLARQPFHEQADIESHQIGETGAKKHDVFRSAEDRHGIARRRVIEGHIGAGEDDDIDDRSGQYVGDAQAQRHSFAQEAAHHGNDATLTHGKDHAEKSTQSNGQDAVFRNDLGDELLRHKFFQQPGNDHTEHNEGQGLVNDARENEDILFHNKTLKDYDP